MKQMDGSSSPGNSNAVLWSAFGKGLWCEEQMEHSSPVFHLWPATQPEATAATPQTKTSLDAAASFIQTLDI